MHFVFFIFGKKDNIVRLHMDQQAVYRVVGLFFQLGENGSDGILPFFPISIQDKFLGDFPS